MGLIKDDPTKRGLSSDGSERLSYDVNRPDLPAGYQSLLDSNPYTNLDYKQSNWQRFLSFLGFRTGYDQRKEDLQLQANEYNANVAAMAFENQYNSEAAKSQRMRAAGLNPDLQGIGDASESAGMAEDTNPPQPTGSDIDQVLQIGSALMNGISTAMTFASGLAGLESIDLDNIQKGINSFSGLLPDDILEGGQLRTDLPIDVLNRGSVFARSLRPRARKRYMENLENFLGSMDFQIAAYNKAAGEKVSHSGYYQARKSAGSDLDDTTLIVADLIRDIAVTTDQINAETDRIIAAAEGAEGENRLTFAENYDPTIEAKSKNMSNEATYHQKKIESAIAKPLGEASDKLEERARNGSQSASRALLGISIAASTMPIIGSGLRIWRSIKLFGRKK